MCINTKRRSLFLILFCLFLVAVVVTALTGNKYRGLPMDGGYTIVALSDTQYYSETNNGVFEKQMNWIVKNAASRHIVFVSHLGDIVQHGASKQNEWEVASRSMSLLEKGNIPYGIIPGNHDADVVNEASSSYSMYNSVFPVERFSTKPWFGGSYSEYQNNYQRIHIDSKNMLILNLEPDPTDEILQWANDVVSLNKDANVIITTHIYLRDNGARTTDSYFRPSGNSGEEIWKKLVQNNCNIFLVLSGHYFQNGGEHRLTSANVCGKPVHQIVHDYQGVENGGNGWLRLFVFQSNGHTMRVFTYSPVLDMFKSGEQSQFEVSVPF